MRHAGFDRWGSLRERLVESAFLLCASVSLLTSVGILAMLLFESVSFFSQVSLFDFLFDVSWTPLFSEKHFGILPLLLGTLLVTLIASLVALPAGLVIAVYLSEFSPSWVRRLVKPVLEVLAGIPTVVYGYFALLTVTPFLQKFIPSLSSFNALSPGLIIGVMVLPMTTSLSEDALRAVPASMREAALALGASRLQTAFQIVLPAAVSGISGAFILALARTIGETMIVSIAAGQQPQFGLNPLAPIQTMTAFIIQVSLGDAPTGTLEFRTIFVVAMVLVLFTLVLNLISERIRIRLRRGGQ
jgi:phosphate transport system permease protein